MEDNSCLCSCGNVMGVSKSHDSRWQSTESSCPVGLLQHCRNSVPVSLGWRRLEQGFHGNTKLDQCQPPTPMRYSARVKDDDPAGSEQHRIGLCFDCLHAQKIESARGSLFYRCQRSDTDPSFPKYPRLPVIQCRGYEQKS